MKNLGLKAVSIVIAFSLAWYVHSESNSAVRTFVAQIEIRNVPPGTIIVAPQNASAQVTVKGPSFIVSKIPNAPPVFSVSLPDAVENRFRTALDPNTLPLPPYVEVLTIEPPDFEFVLEKLVARD